MTDHKESCGVATTDSADLVDGAVAGLSDRCDSLEAELDTMRVDRNTWRTRAHDRYVWLVIRDRTIHQLHLRIKRLEHELWGKEKSA
jgi:hypothetical protein